MKTATTFATTDLYLSAALKLSGFKLIDIKKNHTGKATFLFQDQPDRVRYVREYFSGELQGSLKQFSNVWSDLKALITQIDIDMEQIPNGRSAR